MPLHRIVYYSANRLPAVATQAELEIGRILEASRRNNTLVGVTGALMFNAGFFGQVLEGPLGAVEATFERIQQDPRHGDVALLQFTPVEQRTFESWAMAFVGDDAPPGTMFEDGFDAGAISGASLFEKLRFMVQSYRA